MRRSGDSYLNGFRDFGVEYWGLRQLQVLKRKCGNWAYRLCIALGTRPQQFAVVKGCESRARAKLPDSGISFLVAVMGSVSTKTTRPEESANSKKMSVFVS